MNSSAKRRRWRHFISFHAACLALASFIHIEAAAQSQFQSVRQSLPHHVALDSIRVFYATSGIHAVDATDANRNQIPDQVEDLAKQAWAARALFVETLKFPDPLKSERYRQARFIDIHLLSRKTLVANGRAYDGLQHFKRAIDSGGARSICFDVASSIRAPSNATPAHEMFHLIQNGATYFKTRWYTEGMARWSEHGLKKAGIGKNDRPIEEPWPQSEADRRSLFPKTYDSEFMFWNPLALLDDPQGSLPVTHIPNKLAELTYSNGERVLEDLQLNGWEFMREVLLELGRADDAAFRQLGYRSWTEENQKSQQNSPFIYEAVMDVARKRGHGVGPFSATP